MNVGDIRRLSVAVVVNYKTLPDGKPLPLSNEQMKQIEDLTRGRWAFSEKRGDSLPMSLTRDFNSSDESGEEAAVLATAALSISCWLPHSLVAEPLLVAWLLWRKAGTPAVPRRAEAIANTQQQAQAREGSGRCGGVRLSKRQEQLQQRANQRLGQVMSQRIREMSDNDPRVVALVIRQWISNDPREVA